MAYVNSLFALCLLALSACSSQQVYESVKLSQQANCLNYPEAEYRDCIDETRDSYEQYKQQRDEARDK